LEKVYKHSYIGIVMKNIKFLVLFIAAILVISLSVVLAKPNLISVVNEKSEIQVIIPAHAVELTPGVFSLGTAADVDGRIVEGFLFVYDKKENVKPSRTKGKGGKEKCFAFLAKGARWRTTEQYITGDEINSTLTEISLNTWDSEVLFDIFGTRDTEGIVDGADSESPDGKNEVEFANLGETNTIAYTIVWGIFYGPPWQRELVEWDVVFNSAYPFGDADANPEVMDYQNIATHEFGHALGLAHPDDSCTEETMYRYADYGETKKRDLNTGDIAGIKELYE
jgi:hypothetical protein